MTIFPSFPSSPPAPQPTVETGAVGQERLFFQLIAGGLRLGLFVFLLSSILDPAAAQEKPIDALAASEEQRTDDYAAQLEGYLRKWLVDDYPARATEAWNRDYDSVEAFLESVEPNRIRWRNVVKPPELSVTGDLQRRPHAPLAHRNGEWLTLPLGGLTAEGLVAVPAGARSEKPVPLVIAQHGIG